MKTKWIYRGMKDEPFKELKKKGIPKGIVFTTDPVMAKKHGRNLIAINYSKKGLVESKDNNFVTKNKRKKFVEVGEM